jgi:crotonobetainyl-CoA:carnitine CoA-transferase CaiB-like acyl-CoA transferase
MDTVSKLANRIGDLYVGGQGREQSQAQRRAGLADGRGGALRGLRVVDLSRILAGPLCAQMLADHGATVIKVEAPFGDETRRWGPPFVDPDESMSSYYYGVNRSKANLALDLRRSSGREVLRCLALSADVIIENFKAGTMAAWGLGYADVLAPANSRLIYCQVSGYGLTGVLGGAPGYDAALQAFGGLMSVNGEAGGAPLRVGVPIVDITAAHLAFEGVLLALHERAVSGQGQLIDISLLDAVTSLLHPHAAAWLETGISPTRTGDVHPSVVPYQLLAAADGEQVFVGAASDAQFEKLVRVLGAPELAQDPRFVRNKDRLVNRVALQEALDPLVRFWRAEELATLLLREGLAASPVNDIGTALVSDAVRERAMLIEAESYRGTGIPVKLSVSGSAAVRPPVDVGQDTDDVLTDLGFSPQQVDKFYQEGAFGQDRRVTET